MVVLFLLYGDMMNRDIRGSIERVWWGMGRVEVEFESLEVLGIDLGIMGCGDRMKVLLGVRIMG